MTDAQGNSPGHSDSKREIAVTARDAGSVLVSYLAARFTYQTAAEWTAHIHSGRVMTDGRQCEPDLILAEGARIAFTPPEIPEPEVPLNWRLLFEDRRFLFVDKPAGLPSHPAGRYRKNTLLTLLSKEYSGARLVNRLDRETSGIVVVAKTGDAAGEAAMTMAGGTWKKEYRVAVQGQFPDSIVAEGWLTRDKNSPVRKARRFTQTALARGDASGKEDAGADTGAGDGAEYARTAFTLLRYGGGLSEIRAELFTGRTHQIRATLASLGWPVVGDKLYGGDAGIFLRFIAGELTTADLGFLRMDRQALHCERTAFSSDGVNYDVVCPPPPDWPFPVEP